MSRRGGRGSWSREQQQDARRRAKAARGRVAWERAASLADPDVVDHQQVPDGDHLRPAPSPDDVGSLVRGLVEERGWGERLRGAALHGVWEDVVGVELARRCRPGRLAGGTLVVVVSSPQWATQLRFLEGQIAGRVTAAIGQPVDAVRIVVGDVDAD
jgi:predicted nucleic acid-binding Zn ribbon protein